MTDRIMRGTPDTKPNDWAFRPKKRDATEEALARRDQIDAFLYHWFPSTDERPTLDLAGLAAASLHLAERSLDDFHVPIPVLPDPPRHAFEEDEVPLERYGEIANYVVEHPALQWSWTGKRLRGFSQCVKAVLAEELLPGITTPKALKKSLLIEAACVIPRGWAGVSAPQVQRHDSKKREVFPRKVGTLELLVSGLASVGLGIHVARHAADTYETGSRAWWLEGQLACELFAVGAGRVITYPKILFNRVILYATRRLADLAEEAGAPPEAVRPLKHRRKEKAKRAAEVVSVEELAENAARKPEELNVADLVANWQDENVWGGPPDQPDKLAEYRDLLDRLRAFVVSQADSCGREYELGEMDGTLPPASQKEIAAVLRVTPDSLKNSKSALLSRVRAAFPEEYAEWIGRNPAS